MASLGSLPNEILSLITSHLDGPRDLLHLSLASRRLAAFTKLDGWKALLKGRFGLNGLDADAKNSVHGLTTLHRNWDRKGFVARYLEPSHRTTSLNNWLPKTWRRPHGQTMGYRPSIDSYEEMFGAWHERREVLAWSTGTQIVLRIKDAGVNVEKIRKAEAGLEQPPGQPWTYDSFQHLNCWFSYQVPNGFEGRDDITSLKLLRPHQRDMAFEDIVYGTASGRLSLLSVSPERYETSEKIYDTARRDVGSISVSSSRSPMVAATLGDTTLALYSADHDSCSDDPVAPLTEVDPIIPGARHGRLWSCNFLSADKVAVGLGPSYEPIQIYQIGSEGFLSAPLRTFNLETKFWQGTRSDYNTHRTTSVYPILPIPSHANGASEAGNTFLSGGYDGIIRLHDVRSPRGFESMFWDPTNDSSIYSLAAQGLERIVAGVSMHSMIKVFDLRFSGLHPYHTATLGPPNKPKPKSLGRDLAINDIVNDAKDSAATLSGGWNVYLNPRALPKRNAYREDYWRGREDSPVYSLSIPSATSPNIYAGLEASVESLTFHGVADAHPDPLLSQSIVRFPDSGAVDIKASYNRNDDALNLGMYEQESEEGLGMQLLVQDGVSSNVVKNKERRDFARTRRKRKRTREGRLDQGGIS
ncbi:hypothetical protein IQ07DRAFT_366000 [Pyrenochaeta sp. DS3sAY3a]|nr:hypothetical protein IQ07DRAFT_366000 [Pyrenochaeta sp. DS3sAY3a]